MRAWAAGVCVLLVVLVLSGCQGGSLGDLVGGGGTGPGGEPESGPSVAAPGMNETGVYDSVELARAHTVGLEGRSYTLEIETVVVDRDGVVRYDSTQIVEVGEGGDPVLSRRHAAGRNVSARLAPETVRAYASANRTVLSFTDDGRTRYIEQAERVKLYQNRLLNGFIDSEPIARTTARTLIRIFLGGPDRSRVERIDHGGRAAYRLSGAGPRNRSTPADDVRVEAIVDRFGFVHRLDVTYPASGSYGVGPGGRVTIRMRYTGVGNTTVDRPDWVPAGADAGTGTGAGPGDGRNRTTTGASPGVVPPADSWGPLRGISPDRERVDRTRSRTDDPRTAREPSGIREPGVCRPSRGRPVVDRSVPAWTARPGVGGTGGRGRRTTRSDRSRSGGG